MTSTLDNLIDALVAARGDGPPVDAARFAHVITNADDAYLVQTAVANELDWFGDQPARHWKSGGPSRGALLTHSPLPPARVWTSPTVVSWWPFVQRGVEAEIALRLGEAVDAERAEGLDFDSALLLVDAMAVSIELVASRWQQAFQAPPLLRLADLQSHAALVLGDWQPFTPRDWTTQRCRVRIGPRETELVGTHACQHPGWVLADWLRHATREGPLPAGAVVTTGTWCGMLPAEAGELVEVTFEGIGHAAVHF
ncbi:MAG: hypothetical protein RLZZ618_1349 [Pseudomonadota bacterium]|jgi:2-keto-4-pentenoate hydratase